MMDQEWFEMEDIRQRNFGKAVWIPLRACNLVKDTADFGHVGYKSEFFGTGTLAVPEGKRSDAEELGWMDIGVSHNHIGGVQDEEYIAVEEFRGFKDNFSALHLVLDQRGDGIFGREWHLNQDYVITLGLMREGDNWIRPYEGYMEVARLRRNKDGLPSTLETRATHLRDYLSARNMALYMASYWSREEVVDDTGHILWTENPHVKNGHPNRWEGRISPIHEGRGEPYGEKMTVFHVARTDVDLEEDVPIFELPSDEEVESESRTTAFKGAKIYRVEGELWRNEWVEPAAKSPIVRGDEIPPTVFFIVDAEGKHESRETLVRGSRWLWFRPDVMSALAHRRGGTLGWYTKDTGSVGCAPDSSVHFDVNSLGLINVYAKDIALLPDWQQRIWAGYNVSSEGKVSEELLESQMKAAPANTKAPEAFFAGSIAELNEIIEEKFDVTIIKDHEQAAELIKRTHRFRATSKEGLFSLAKDLARLTADSIDAKAVQKIVSPPKNTKWGSLKSLEKFLATIVEPNQARTLMGPLFGIYELRHLDAHLTSDEADEALKLANVDQEKPLVMQGYQLLFECVNTIFHISRIISAHKIK